MPLANYNHKKFLLSKHQTFTILRYGLLAANGAENGATAAVTMNVVNRTCSVAALYAACFIIVWKALVMRSQICF